MGGLCPTAYPKPVRYGFQAAIAHDSGRAEQKEQLFPDEAILAIHQGSGGLLRRANLLAKGALIGAAREKCQVVSPEHVRIAASEIM
jgi:type II secretory pathway predicted ATPase ExeA